METWEFNIVVRRAAELQRERGIRMPIAAREAVRRRGVTNTSDVDVLAEKVCTELRRRSAEVRKLRSHAKIENRIITQKLHERFAR